MDPRQWDSGLQLLAGAARARAAVLTIGDLVTRESRVLHQAGQPPEAIAAYDGEYFRIAPLMREAARVPQGEWHDWMTRDPEWRHSAYYNEFLLPHGNYASITNVLWQQGNRFAAVGLQRTREQGGFDEEDQLRLAPLVPDLRRALKLYFATRELRAQASLRTAVVDQLAAPVFVVDSGSRVLLANRSAQALCRAQASVCMLGGLLLARGDGSRLQAAIESATQASGARGCLLRMPRAATPDASLLAVAPLPASSLHCRPWERPLAVVIAGSPQAPHDSLADILRVLFGVTRAEARIAHCFAEGLSIAEIAERSAIQVQTVRGQLKSLFSKLGVRRQAELSRLLAGVQAVLPQVPAPSEPQRMRA
jgi:DNA-binding CsgD family transcriptional regulator